MSVLLGEPLWNPAMTDTSRKTYRPWNPAQYRQQTHSPLSKLPEGDLVFFLLDIVPLLDLRRFYAPYEDERRGAPPFDPAMMVCLLLYAYCVGVYSSRKIATACERNLAFLAIVGTDRPDFRTVSDFRKLHLETFADTFTQVLRLAKEAGLVKLGVLATDGTKVAGNASRHKAMSYGYMTKEVERLRAEIDALLRQAQEQDADDDAALGSRRGDELPDELKRREDRLATLQAAQQRLEEQARAAAEAERLRRQEVETERQRTGQKRRGREPGPIDEAPDAKAQTNFTDPELKIMKTNNKGWDYCGNAQAVVDGACQIIVACDVTGASNDKEQAVPMATAALANLEQAGIERPTDASGQVVPIPNLTDSGYYSEKAARGVQALQLDPYMATERQRHHAAAASAALPPATAKETMTAKLRTAAGRALYALRKTIVEPVFGQIKGARAFRRFLLRGLEKIRGEWRLVCLTHNLLKIWRYRCAPSVN
jgi:transposase